MIREQSGGHSILRRAGRSLKRVGSGVFWPLLLVAGLMVFTTVDADGDPMTANTPAVVLSRVESSEVDAGVGEPPDDEVGTAEAVGPRKTRRGLAHAWLARMRSAWLRLTGPIRGP